jgi:hypothetical protein
LLANIIGTLTIKKISMGLHFAWKSQKKLGLSCMYIYIHMYMYIYICICISLPQIRSVQLFYLFRRIYYVPTWWPIWAASKSNQASVPQIVSDFRYFKNTFLWLVVDIL